MLLLSVWLYNVYVEGEKLGIKYTVLLLWMLWMWIFPNSMDCSLLAENPANYA